jgi:hypothetical protein
LIAVGVEKPHRLLQVVFLRQGLKPAVVQSQPDVVVRPEDAAVLELQPDAVLDAAQLDSVLPRVIRQMQDAVRQQVVAAAERLAGFGVDSFDEQRGTGAAATVANAADHHQQREFAGPGQQHGALRELARPQPPAGGDVERVQLSANVFGAAEGVAGVEAEKSGLPPTRAAAR